MADKIKRAFSILDLFFERELDKWEASIPLELRQKQMHELEARELDQMIAGSNNSAGQFAMMTAMYAQAEVEIKNLDNQLMASIAKEKESSGKELDRVRSQSERLAVSLTRSRARLAQLKKKIDLADQLDDKSKAMIYERAAEMRDNAFDDRMDLIQSNMNQIQSSMNDAMRRQIDVLNTGTDFKGKRKDMHDQVVQETAEVEDATEILQTLLDAEQQTQMAQRAAVTDDAAVLLATLRGEQK